MKKIIFIFIIILGMTLSFFKVSASEIADLDEEEITFSMKDYFQNLYENSPDNDKGTCSYVAFIQYLSYYDTFYNDNIILNAYEINDVAQSYDECIENSPGVLKQKIEDNIIEYIETYKDIDFQAKLIDIVYNNRENETDNYISIKFLQYDTILENLLPSYNIIMERNYYKDLFGDISYDDPEVIDWYDSYIKRQLDLGNPVIVGIKYRENETKDLENHAVVAYYYDEEGIHANFGWGVNSEDMIINEYSYIIETAVLDFSDMPEVHSNNYKINDVEYCGCGYKTHTHTYYDEWTSVSDIAHTRTCIECNYIKNEEHSKHIEGEYIKCENCSWIKSIRNDFNDEIQVVNSFDRSNYNEYIIHFLELSTLPEDLRKLEIKQTSTFDLWVRSNKSISLFIFKEDFINNELLIIRESIENSYANIEITLLDGTYYIGYYSNYEENYTSLKLKKLVDTEGEGDYFITDPSNLWLCGSQITVAEEINTDDERTYNQNTIIEGFTRIIYLSSGSSRQDYYWYSSNDDIATVSSFGTVLGKSVTEDTTIKIMAVNKSNPKIIYIEEFTILNDTFTYERNPIEITINITMKTNEEKNIDLSNVNVPINILQYYQWISSDYNKISVSYFGTLSSNSCQVGDVIEVTGLYRYNSRVKIRIQITIVE